MAALGINLVLGILYAWGVLAKALVTDWGWTKTQAAMPFTFATASFAITMIFAGRLQDRIGPRFVAMFGGIVFGCALLGSSLASTPGAMVLAFGIIGGIGIGLGYSSTTPPAIKWFPPQRKGLITGLVVSGVGIAAVYASPLAEFLLTRNTIPQTFMYLGGGAIVAVVLFSQFLTNPPENHNTNLSTLRSTEKLKHQNTGDLDWPEMLRTPQFYILWTMFVMAASAGLMIIAHVAIIGREQAGLQWGFMPIAMLAIFNTLGRIISGYISDRIGRRNTMILAFALQAGNMFCFSFYTTPGLVLFGAAFTGLCYGTIFTLMPAATADYYGLRNFGVNYGTLFTAFGVAGVLGPILGGMIRDKFGVYSYSFTISAILLLTGAALALLLRPPVRRFASH
jgi:MFS transporter, OFA family, oxalate/formate antiporter